nr:hemagglutinin repeat-containing protein [Stutzerimonas nitrititolerans]
MDLSAGNDLLITAAGNAQGAEEKRRSGGGEVGLTFGSEGIGVYASVNLGRGNLEREGERQQEAYLYAGNRLGFDSGRDTAIAGAQLRGNDVIGRVGGDLLVTSLADTGEVKGREFDLSATVTIGPGSGFSGSVGYGETSGSTHWVENQTRITAAERLDIRTENHTQIDGALIASDSGDLKLDTDTLGFSDIAGHDKEHSYYLNVGGSYSSGGGTQQDASQVGKGKEGESGWSVEGYKYERDRQQIVRATVGEGEIVVRNDEQTGNDSTAGLNRDAEKAYEITKDKEERTDLYVSKTSLEAVGKVAERVTNEIQAQRVSVDQVPTSAKQTLGEERAISVAKNMVRHGLSPDVMASLSPATAQLLAAWADAAEGFDQASTGTNTSQVSADSSSSSSANNNGALDLGSVTTIGVVTPGASFLQKTAQLQGYLQTLPVEEAQVVRVGMQALMGPAKAAVSLAGNVLLNAVFGDQIDALKEGAAIGMTAGLVGEDKATVQKEHEKAKQEYAAGNDEYLNGDGYVLASRFLIDIVAGEIGSLGGKVAGRAIGVAPVNTGGPQGAAKSEMLGAGGTQTASKTLWKGNGKERIDVENPNPGQRPGQVHYQDNKNNKYIYDPETNSFPGAPRSVNEMLNDARFKAAIEKALTKYLGR